MFAESKLTFAAWTGFGITAATIGTVVYQRSGGFGISNKENSETGNNLMKKLTQEELKNKEQDKKEEFSEPKPDQNLNGIVQEPPKAKELEEENEKQSLVKEKEQGEDPESFDSGIPSFEMSEDDEKPQPIK